MNSVKQFATKNNPFVISSQGGKLAVVTSQMLVKYEII